MTDLTLESLNDRVNCLERQNRRLKTLAVVVVAVFAAVVCLGQVEVPEAVQAEKFVVRDTDGKQRGVLGVDEDGQPGLSLLGVDGKSRANLTLDRDGRPCLTLRGLPGEVGEGRIVLGIDDHDTYRLMICARKGKACASVSARDQGPAMVMLWGAERNHHVTLSCDRPRIAGLEVHAWPDVANGEMEGHILRVGLQDDGSLGLRLYEFDH